MAAPKLLLTEDDHLRATLRWAQLAASRWPCLRLLLHYPGENKGQHSGRQRRQKGVRPGVPDLLLPVARAGYHGLAVEIKRPRQLDERGRIRSREGVLSPEQRDWLEALEREGWRAETCYGADAAIRLVENYVSGSLQRPASDPVLIGVGGDA